MMDINAVFAVFACAFFAGFHHTDALIQRPPCPKIRIENGRMRYRQKSGFAQFMCNKSYTLAGGKYMKCTLGEWEGEPPLCVKNTCKATGVPKFGFLYPENGGGVMKFFCLVGYQLNGPGTIYCDGNKWSNYRPSCIASTRKVSIDCDFEHEDLCGWTHDINHDFDWTRLSNSTPSWHVGTGPTHDHTLGATGEGYYMYIETTSQKPDDTARLISPVYAAQANDTCLEFYYHMRGIRMGELRVYAKRATDGWDLSPTDAVFTVAGNQGDDWIRAFVHLGPIDQNFQIIMEGVRGGSYLSDIAIDDIRIIENCAEEFDESTTISSTTDVSTEEQSFDFDTCSSRCGLKSWNHSSSCDCDKQCILLGTCCADYIAVCLLPEISSEENDEEGTTPDCEEGSTTTEMATSEDTTETTEEDATTPIADVETTEHVPVLRVFNRTSWRLRPKTTTTSAPKRAVTIKFTTTPRMQTSKKPAFTPSFPKIIVKPPPFRPARTKPAINYKKSYTNNRTFKDKENDYFKQDMLTLPPRRDDTDEPVEVLFSTKVPLKYIMLQKKSELKADSSNLMALVGAGVAGLCVVVIAVACVVRRRPGCGGRMRRRNGSHGDSASDVRFLTSNEALDFRLSY